MMMKSSTLAVELFYFPITLLVSISLKLVHNISVKNTVVG